LSSSSILARLHLALGMRIKKEKAKEGRFRVASLEIKFPLHAARKCRSAMYSHVGGRRRFNDRKLEGVVVSLVSVIFVETMPMSSLVHRYK
jgi:hypothetical protein